MDINNIFLGPLYFFGIVFIAFIMKNSMTRDEVEAKYYMRALWLKLIGATSFAMIYYYYYGGGDSIGYYEWSSCFFRYIFDDFSGAMQFLFTDDIVAFNKFKYYDVVYGYGYLLKPMSRETTFIKMASVINLFSFNSYLSTSYLFAFIAFLSNWKLYQMFSDYFPKIKKPLAYSVLFVPSVIFWGSSILKDTITFSALALLVYAIYKIFICREKMLLSILVLIASGYVLMVLKGYILLAILPAAIFWVYGEYKDSIKSDTLRLALTPLFFIVSVAMLFGLMNVISSSLGRFSLESIDSTVKDFQGWHKAASVDGSGYDLNVSGTSAPALIAAFPKAVNVTYFRPYLWEVSGLVVFLAAVESLFFFCYFLYLFVIKGRIFGFIRAALSDPVIVMTIIFALFFGFVVGFTSYNFGALSRYKVPSMPFFATFLVLVAHKIEVLRQSK